VKRHDPDSEVAQLARHIAAVRRLDVVRAHVLQTFAQRIKDVRDRMLAGGCNVAALTHELATLREAQRLVEGT
jgi:hypothetical protein